MAVLGAGVIGLACARALALRGARVTLIEAQTHSREASWAAGGMLAPHSEFDRPDPLFGLGRVSLALYPSLRDALRETTGHDIDLRLCGTLVLYFTEDEMRTQRMRPFLDSVGVDHRLLTAEEVRREEPSASPEVVGALEVPDHAVDNRRLWEALHADCTRLGVRLAFGCPIERVTAANQRISEVHSGEESFRAGEFVIAAGAWSRSLAELMGFELPVVPVKGQMLRLTVTPDLVRHVLRRGSHYLVPREGPHLVVGATTEHAEFDKSLTDQGLEHLLQGAVSMVPTLATCAVEERWAGLRPRLADGLPGIGRAPHFENLTLATGHYRNGILLTPITGEAVASVVLGEKPPVDLAPFDPRRFS